MTTSMLKKRANTGSVCDERQSEGRIVGTPDYMAPEMLEGKGLDQPAIDYWAVGVILFELIVGIPPFNASTIEEIFSNIRANRVPWDDLIGENGEEVITPEAKSLIEGLLNSDPSQRLGSSSAESIKAHSFFDGSHSSFRFRLDQTTRDEGTICA